MFPLAASICLELYPVGYLSVRSARVALVSVCLAAFFMGMWFLLPNAQRRRLGQLRLLPGSR
jgi:hypothetical protein